MARRPFFTGDYGSALGRIDTRPIIEAGRAQGQMYANLGAQAAKAIETYQLNKEERAKLTGEIEQDILNYGNSLTQTGNEDIDKKNQLLIEKFQKGNASIPDMRNLAGSLARAQLNEQKQMENEMRDLKTRFLLADEARKKDEEERKKAAEERTVAAEERTRAARIENMEALIEAQTAEEAGELTPQQANLIAQTDAIMRGDPPKPFDPIRQEEIRKIAQQQNIRDNNKNILREIKEKIADPNYVTTVRDKHFLNYEEEIGKGFDIPPPPTLREQKELDPSTQITPVRYMGKPLRDYFMDERGRLLRMNSKTGQLSVVGTQIENVGELTDEDREEIDKSQTGGSPVSPVVARKAFGGTLEGQVSNFANSLSTYFGFATADSPIPFTDKDRIDQQANLDTIRSIVMPGMVKAIGSKPSNYTMEIVQKSIPLTTDDPEVGMAKLRKLVEMMKTDIANTRRISKTLSPTEDTEEWGDARDKLRMLEPLYEVLLQSLDPSRSRIPQSIQNILNRGGVSIDSNVTDQTPSSGIENLSDDELLMRLNQSQ
mgnify:CR=1 FL=1